MNKREQIKRYDDVQNEGYGDSYNPHREDAERAAMDADASRAKSPSEQLDAVRSELERKDCSIARECGTYDEAELKKLRTEARRLESVVADEARARLVAAGWTVDETQKRRAMWNEAVTAAKRSGFDSSTPAKIQDRLGFSFYDLRDAVAAHGLAGK